ncbi:MAG: hypothetical protein FJX76_28820, partial [Armatimonadetes bacterium]|nr:hypothetical protein [Armatimonadota bacterium]
MDSKTVAIIGAASSLDGLSLRDCWNGPMGGGCGPENPPPGASTLVEVVAAALEDAGSRGPFAFQQTIGVACAGADPAAIATALRLDGPRESGNDLLDLLSLASAHVLRRAADTMVVCVAEGRDNAAVVLRRYRESWRSGLHLYALVRGCGVTDALPTSTTMLEIVDSCEVPGSGQVEACWVGSWSRGGKSAAIHAMASLLRTALAVHDRILPTSFPRGEERSLPPGRHFMTAAPRPWFHGNELRPRRAAVVQGSRAALLEEPPRSYLDSIRRKADAWPCELFLLAAPDRTALLERVRQLATLLAGEMPRLSDLAGALAAADLGGPCRLAMLASTAEALRALLHTAEEKLADPSTTRLRMPGAIYFGDGSTAPDRVALLFPGNGSQYVGMLHDVCLALPSVQAWLDYFDESLADGGMTPSQVFYPTPGLAVDPEHPVARKLLTLAETGGQATVMVSLALNELLVELRVPHDVVAGFSIGEVSALVASDVLRLRQARDILSAISELVVRPTDLIHGERPRYPLLVVQLPERKLLDEVLAASSEALYVALDCCPSQVVLCGSEKAIAAAE